MIHTKYLNRPPVEYFTEAEAKEKGIPYVHWKKATRAGEWVLSDDGYVLQVTELKPIIESRTTRKGDVRSRTRWRLRTGLTMRFLHGRSRMEIVPHIRTRSYGFAPQNWWDRFDALFPAVRSLLTKLVMTNQLRMTKDHRYQQNEYDHFIRIANQIFDDVPTRNWWHIRMYFGRDEVREQIRKDIQRIAIERGVTVEKVFDIIGEAEGYARTKKDGKVLLQIAKEYGAIIGMTALMKNTGEEKSLPEYVEGASGVDANAERIIKEHHANED